jgi:hypothetical protein
MKKILFVITIAIALAACSLNEFKPVTVSGPVDVIIIAGQSNAAGYTDYRSGGSARDVAGIYNTGRPVGFVEFIPGYSHYLGGRTDCFGVEIPISEELENRTVFIKTAWGGTTMRDRWNLETGDLAYAAYGRILHAMNELAEDGADPTIRGIVWIQGESDSVIPTAGEYYRDDLVDVLSFLRQATGDASAPIVICESLVQRSRAVYLPDVQAAQHEAAGILGAAIIETDDLNTSDGAHLDGPSMMTLGRRVYAALMEDK